MTRINCIPVEELTDKHLRAEFYELPRVFTAIERQEGKPSDLPTTYRMGTGHVRFFYDKALWLAGRLNDIADEMMRRGWNVDDDKLNAVFKRIEELPSWSMNDWQPDEEAQAINRARIIARLI